MRSARSVFIALILAAVGLRVIWWSIEPMIPYVLAAGVAGLFLLMLYSWIFYRRG